MRDDRDAVATDDGGRAAGDVGAPGAPRRLSHLCAAFLASIVVVTAAGLALGKPGVASFIPSSAPIRSVTLVTLAVLTAGVALQHQRRRVISAMRTACAAAVLLITVTGVTTAAMPRNAALAFVTAAGALLLVDRKRAPFSIAARLCIGVAAVTAVHALVTYAYGITAFGRTFGDRPMAFSAALALAVAAIALGAGRYDEKPFSLIAGSSTAALTARVLIPGCIVLPLAGGWLRLYGERLGLYGTAAGAAMFASFTIVALVAMVTWSTARAAAYERERAETHVRLRKLVAGQEAIAGASLKLVHVMRLVVAQAQELTAADGAALVEIEGDLLRFKAAVGTLVPHLDMPAEHAAETFAGHAILRNACRVAPAGSRAVERPLRDAAPDGHVVAVPLTYSGSVIAALLVTRTRDTFDPEEVDLLQLMAPVAAAALAHRRQFQTTEAVVEEQSAELSTLNQRFSAFMSHVPAATFIKDGDGNYLYGNPMLGAFLQRDLEEIIGAHDRDFLPPELAEVFRETEQRVLEGEAVDAVTVRLFGGDDAPSWLILRFLLKEPGRRGFIGGVAVDVTAQTAAEQRVRELNETLERRVEERTAELTNANRELEAFSYSVSHDLRAPLRAIDGYARMITEDYGPLLDAEGERFLGVIRSESRRMARLIDDLLAFSRVGRTALSPTVVDVAALAREVMAEIRAGLPGRELILDVGEIPHAEGDRTILRHAVMNLMQNAVKYSKPSGPVLVRFRGEEGADFNTYCVRDSGVGFDMTYAHKLFGVFQRLHSDEEFEGTGVGLAIVRRIVERHGGRCWAEGEVGAGAAFFFTLPAQRLALTTEEEDESLQQTAKGAA